MILNLLKESLLQESKQDIDNFINKFGKDTYELFKKSTQRLKNNKISTDLTYHIKNTSKKELDNILFALQSKVKTKNYQDLSNGIPGKFNYLGEFDGYKVYQPLDYISSMSLGVNTGWCTTGRYGHYGDPNFKPSERDAKKHFEDYTKEGVKFYYFLDSKTMYGKYALALYNRELNVQKCIGDYYIISTNFEIYNAEDELDYSVMNKLPLDKLDIKLEYDIEKTKNGLFIRDGVLLKVKKDLVNVTIPDSVTSIGLNAFLGCSSLTSITIPDSVTSIGNGAFCNCSSLTSITIPSSVTSVRDRVFSSCSSLSSITIPNSVTSIGSAAFGWCSSLTSITIPNGVKSIGRWAFCKCTSLKSITIPNGVTSIEGDTFYDCNSLTSIIIPDSVKKIEKTAFSGCENLTIYTNNQRFINEFKNKFPVKPLN